MQNISASIEEGDSDAQWVKQFNGISFGLGKPGDLDSLDKKDPRTADPASA